jgi:uncharacterized protein (DUF2147 family)
MKASAACLSLIGASLLQTGPARADAPPSAIGFWVTQDHGGVVEVMPCDRGLCGQIVGLRTDLPRDEDRKDVKNPDPARRGEPLCGLRLMGGLEPDKSDPTAWKNGWVYDPESGSTYSARIKLDGPDTMKLRGYIGLPMFGRSETWTRESGESRNRCKTAS